MARRTIRPTSGRGIACALGLLLGCDPVSPPGDGGVEDDAATEAAFVVMSLAVYEEEELPPEWELSSAHVRLREVHADNDRGGDLEPVWIPAPSWVWLNEEPPEARLPAVPATYGGVTLESTDGVEPTLELVYQGPEGEVVVVSRRPFAVAVRCEGGGVTLPPAAEIALAARLDIVALAATLDAADLPPPIDGSIEISEATAPDVIAAIEAALPGAWRLDCEGA